MHRIKFLIGDPWGDGHSQTDEFLIESNLDIHDIRDAFNAGVEVLGFNITECCEEYQDNELTPEQQIMLENSGFELECDGSTYSDEFLLIYFHTVKLGNPEFEVEVLEFPRLHIGGYGLFC